MVVGAGRGGEDRLVKLAFWSARAGAEMDGLLAAGVVCNRSDAPVGVVVHAELEDVISCCLTWKGFLQLVGE